MTEVLGPVGKRKNEFLQKNDALINDMMMIYLVLNYRLKMIEKPM